MAKAKKEKQVLEIDPRNEDCLRNIIKEVVSDIIKSEVPRLVAEQLLGLEAKWMAKIDQTTEEVKRDIKVELAPLAKEVSDLKDNVDTNSTQIEQLETWSKLATDVLDSLLSEHGRLISKVEILDTKDKRNHIRVSGIPERSEGNVHIKEYMKQWISKELGVDANIELAYRVQPRPASGESAVSSKQDNANAVPRTVMLGFVNYQAKQQVLAKAWAKKQIMIGGNRVFFDHDYSSQTLQKRKEYTPIKKALKRLGIPYKTPFSRIEIHWHGEDKRSYESANDALAAMRTRGHEVEGTTKAKAGSSRDAMRKLLESPLLAWRTT